MQQFDIAVTNFQTKYNRIPGDSGAFGCISSSNICDNGIIEPSGGYAVGFESYFTGEISNFWPVLQQGGFMQDKAVFSNTYTGTFKISGTAPNSPKMQLGDNTGVIVHNLGDAYSTTAPSWFSNNPHFYIMYNFTNADIANNTIYSSSFSNGSIKAIDALAVDKKIDDGSSNKLDLDIVQSGGALKLDGKIVFDFLSSGCSKYDDDFIYTNEYNITNPNAKCSIAIKGSW